MVPPSRLVPPLLPLLVSLLLAPFLRAQDGGDPGSAATIAAGKGVLQVDLGGVALELFTYKPATFRGERMILVLHGVLRNADEYRDHAVGMADRFGALIVAPRFDRERFPSRRYQMGGVLQEDRAAAPAHERTYALVPKIAGRVRELTGLPSLPFWVIGHSAGGQFVMRMSAFQDTGAVRLVAANPGSDLFPTRDLPFGYGFGRLPPELADDAALQRYLAAPLTIYLGTADDGPDENFDGSRNAMQQGAGRHQRGLACYWTARTLARERSWTFGWRLVEAPGVGHDHEKMFDHAACERALFGGEEPAAARDARTGPPEAAAPRAERADALPWSREQMAEDIRALAEGVRKEWSYLEHRTGSGVVDLDQLTAAAERQLDAVQSRADLLRVLRRFVSALQDGHAAVLFDGGAPPQRRLPFLLAECREGFVVTAVAAGEGARPARGDLLLELDGRPVAQLRDEQLAEVFGSTPGMRARLALDRVQWVDGERAACRFSTADGRTLAVDVPTLPAEPPELRPPGRGTESSLSWPREGVAMLRIPSFAVDRWQEWLQAKVSEREGFLQESKERIERTMAEIARGGANTLILDLRGNGGGTDLLGIHLAEHLLEKPFRYFLLSAQMLGRWPPPHGFEYGKRAVPNRFAGKLLALVDEGCFSVTDNFLRCLDDMHPDFTVVGRPTGGGTGAPRSIVKLPHCGAEVILCTQRVHGPNGALIEGSGTVPDVQVTWSRDDWLQGRDPDLAAALAAAVR